MKKYVLLLVVGILGIPSLACEICEANQPEVLKGISHGTGPQSQMDMPIIWASAIIVLITLIYSVKFLVHPKEADPDHIKRRVLRNTPIKHG